MQVQVQLEKGGAGAVSGAVCRTQVQVEKGGSDAVAGCRWKRQVQVTGYRLQDAGAGGKGRFRCSFRWRRIAMGLYLETPRSSSSAETTSYSVSCSKRTGKIRKSN